MIWLNLGSSDLAPYTVTKADMIFRQFSTLISDVDLPFDLPVGNVSLIYFELIRSSYRTFPTNLHFFLHFPTFSYIVTAFFRPFSILLSEFSDVNNTTKVPLQQMWQSYLNVENVYQYFNYRL